MVISKPTILMSSGCGCIMMSVVMSIYHLQILYIARKLEDIISGKGVPNLDKNGIQKYIKVEKI